MKQKTWTEDDLRQAVKDHYSIAGTLRTLGLRPIGGNYITIKKWVQKLHLDTSHWTGQGWSKGQKIHGSPRQSTQAILVKNSSYTSTSHLKHRLLKEGLLRPECYVAECRLTTWLGEPLTLHLDHVNGDRMDNRLENLQLLCPNCHSQTSTYCGRSHG